MKRSETRILTTHVGSLPRPPELLDLGSYEKGPPENIGRYREVMARAIADIVK